MIKEAVKAATKQDKGPFAIATKSRIGGLRRVPDTRFDTWDRAHRYGMKYHTDRYGAQMFTIVQHPDAKKKIDEDIANVAGDAVSTSNVHWSYRQPKIGPKGNRKKYGQPISFNTFIHRRNKYLENLQVESLQQVNGRWALVSKETGRPLAYYKGEGKPSDDWVKKQERRVQYFKHMKG